MEKPFNINKNNGGVSSSNIIYQEMINRIRSGQYSNIYNNTGPYITVTDEPLTVGVSPTDSPQMKRGVATIIKENHILIEPLAYGDFYIGVYSENNNPLLDTKYYTKSLLSAKITAYELSKDKRFKDYSIYICNNNPLDGTINYEKIVLKYKNEDTPETTN